MKSPLKEWPSTTPSSEMVDVGNGLMVEKWRPDWSSKGLLNMLVK